MRYSRLGLLSRYAHHHSRSHSRPNKEGHVCRSGEGLQADPRLGSALRLGDRSLDHRYVCGGRFQTPHARPPPMKLIVLTMATLSALVPQPGPPPAPPPPAKAAAPIDLTGYWVSQIVDEWRFRV